MTQVRTFEIPQSYPRGADGRISALSSAPTLTGSERLEIISPGNEFSQNYAVTLQVLATAIIGLDPPTFDTRTAAAAASIPTSRQTILTGGFANPGDGGGALYVRTGASSTGGFQSADGSWWALVRVHIITPQMFGAKGDNSNDDTAAFRDALNYVGAGIVGVAPSGLLTVPKGAYVLRTGITVPDYVRVVGAGQTATFFSDGGNNTNAVVTLSGFQAHLENLTVFGCGRAGTNDPIPSFPAVTIPSNNQDAPVLRNVSIFYGSPSLQVNTQDVVLDNCAISYSYASSIVHIGNVGQVWAHRTSFDQSWPQSLPVGGTANPSAWAANTTYAVGGLAIIGGVTCQVMSVTSDAKSGSVQPNASVTYQTNIVDNHVTWQTVFYNNSYACVLVDSNSTNENYFDQCDFSTSAAYGVRANSSGLSFVGLHNCIIGGMSTAAVRIDAVSQMFIEECELSAGFANGFSIWTVAGATGNLLVDGSWVQGNGGTTRAITLSAAGVTAIIKGCFIGAQGSTGNALVTDTNIGNFIISECSFYNWSSGFSVLISSGSADHYNVVNCLLGGAPISDGGSGVNKTVSGNH